jgi:hypothetical protein
VSCAAITLCVASQRVFIVVSVHFVISSVRKLLVTSSYIIPSFRDRETLLESHSLNENEPSIHLN